MLYWADSNGMQSPGHKIIREILDSLLNADEDKKSQVNFRQTQYRKYRDRVYLLDGKSFSDLEILRSQKIVWNKESRLDLDPVSHLKFDVTQGDGIRYPKKVPVIIKFRKGGERSHPSGREHSNSLKNAFKSRVWNRGGEIMFLLFTSAVNLLLLGIYGSRKIGRLGLKSQV